MWDPPTAAPLRCAPGASGHGEVHDDLPHLGAGLRSSRSTGQRPAFGSRRPGRWVQTLDEEKPPGIDQTSSYGGSIYIYIDR